MHDFLWCLERWCRVCYKECCLLSNILPQSIRSFLKGKAKSLLLTLPTDANPAQIFTTLDNVFGNIYPKEKLIQQFYASQPKNCGWLWFETEVISEAISLNGRNGILGTKLWSELKDSNLQNSSRFKYETINNF